MAEEKLFDIDEAGARFQPVAVKYRGEIYLLGESALGIMQACELHGELADEKSSIEASKLMGALPTLLTFLCPGFPTDDLKTGEQLALLQAVTEVLSRIGSLTFPSQDE